MNFRVRLHFPERPAGQDTLILDVAPPPLSGSADLDVWFAGCVLPLIYSPGGERCTVTDADEPHVVGMSFAWDWSRNVIRGKT